MSTITLVTKTIGGQLADGGSADPVYSADGTLLAFSSLAGNLAPGDTNGRRDIFVENLSTGVINRVSTAADGSEGNGESGKPVFSRQGTKIAFTSLATNLVPGGTNGSQNVYVKDLLTGAITLVSSTASGGQADSGTASTGPVFSPDGSKVAFKSSATNLVAGDSNDHDDIFVKDLVTGAITRISTSSSGGQVNRPSANPAFSPDGTSVAFYSTATNLVAGDTNGALDVFVKNLVTGAVTRVSTTASGAQVNANPVLFLDGDDDFNAPSFSPDGTRLAFESISGELVSGDTNDAVDIFVKDLGTGAITRVSTDVNDGQTPPKSSSSAPVFSPDGTKVLFASTANNLVPGTGGPLGGLYVKDLGTGEITLVTKNADGVQSNGFGILDRGAFSPDGSRIAFASFASNLVPGDTNGEGDVFITSFEVPPVTVADAYRAGYDAPLAVGAAQGLVVNDTDLNGDTLTAALVAGPTHGSVTIRPDGSFTYTPDGRFIGIDQFTYRAFDGAKFGAAATVSITVTGNIARVSTSATGAEAFRGASDYTPVLSPDGAKVAFTSFSPDLTPGGTGGFDAVFVKDMATGAITLVSVDANGLKQQGGNSSAPVFSADGARLAFTSESFRLGSGSDVVVKNLVTGALIVASTDAAGAQVQGFSGSGVFSPDGAKVAFASSSSGLTPGDTNGVQDLFVKDLASGAVTRISTDAGGGQANGSSALPVFSPDGTKVAFVSSASNLAPGDTNGFGDIFVKDLVSGAVTRVSAGSGGAQANGNSDAPVFSPDGAKVAFSSAASNLVGGDINGIADIFVKDMASGAITLVSTNAAGVEAAATGTLGSVAPVFSPDGTRIAFVSPGTNLVAGDTNGVNDIFVKNLVTGSIRRVSADAFEAQADGRSSRPAFSPDGKRIAFVSFGASLVPGDTNGAGDVFVKDLARFPLGATANAAPVAAGESYTTNQDTRLTVTAAGVLANDVDANGDALSAVLVAGPGHGVLALGANGGFTYTPAAGYSGADSFRYLASDGVDTSSPVMVALSVMPVNRWVGAADNDWSNPANWSQRVAPGAADDVVVARGAPRITADVGVVHSLTVTSPGALTIAGGALSVRGDSQIDGAVAIQGGALVMSGNLAGAGAFAIDGNATVTIGGAVGAGETLSLVNGVLKLSSPAGFLGTIAAFSAGDAIDLTTLTFAAGDQVTLLTGNVLEITHATGAALALRLAAPAAPDAAGVLDLRLGASDDYAGLYFHLASDGAGGTAVTVDGTPCYCRGTLILTAGGEVPVEELVIGDVLVTAAGMLRPIRWIGRRAYAGRFANGNRDVLPVCFVAGALGDGLPRRDLWVSPRHAMFIDGMLIPAEQLVNGASVFQARTVELVEYFHVELASHDVILAEGAPSETFVDDCSRGMFGNAREFAILYPDAPRSKRQEPPRRGPGRLAGRDGVPASNRAALHRPADALRSRPAMPPAPGRRPVPRH